MFRIVNEYSGIKWFSAEIRGFVVLFSLIAVRNGMHKRILEIVYTLKST